MNAFLSLPDWAPGWLGPVLVILGALFALAFLLMPFTVFSLKSRLEQIELKLEDIHADLQALGAPDPAAVPRSNYAWPEPASATADRIPVHPPIPPAPPRYQPDRAPEGPPSLRAQVALKRDEPRRRAEPKLNWPR